jgi:hypothetical protein
MVHFAIRCNYKDMERHRNEAGRYIYLKMEACRVVRVEKTSVWGGTAETNEKSREEKAGE